MPFAVADVVDLIAILRETAQREVMPRFAHLDPADVRTKAHASDFVTVADEAAEAMIEAMGRARFGDFFFLGEEVMERQPDLIDRLADAPRALVVDPIDGTFNYANGIPAFAMIAAVLEAGEVVAGVLYDPVRDDAVWAIAGAGAFLEGPSLPRRPVQVAAARPLAEMHGACSWAYAVEPLRSRMLAGSAGVWGTYNYRCGGQEMRMLATGGGHFGIYSKLSPWDNAAGWLIHREAGGYSAHFDGSGYKPWNRDGGLIMAPDKASYDLLKAQFID